MASPSTFQFVSQLRRSGVPVSQFGEPSEARNAVRTRADVTRCSPSPQRCGNDYESIVAAMKSVHYVPARPVVPTPSATDPQAKVVRLEESGASSEALQVSVDILNTLRLERLPLLVKELEESRAEIRRLRAELCASRERTAQLEAMVQAAPSQPTASCEMQAAEQKRRLVESVKGFLNAQGTDPLQSSSLIQHFEGNVAALRSALSSKYGMDDQTLATQYNIV